MHSGCEVLCFSLAGCLLRKLSPGHSRFEETVKTQRGNSLFLQELLGKQAAEQDVLILTEYATSSSAESITLQPTKEYTTLSTEKYYWARVNL